MMAHTARPRHPVTGRRLTLRAQSPRELDAYLHRLDTMRADLKLQLRTPEQVEHELRHLRYGVVTFERAARSFLERPLAANTRRTTRGLLEGHFATLRALPLAALDVPTLSRWVEGLQRAGLAGTTIGTVWRRLRAIVAHAAERGWIGALPWGPWRPRLSAAPARALREAARSFEELAQLLVAAQHLDGLAMPGRLPAIEAKIACAALLGLRQGELAGLRWTDIDERPSVLVARQYDGAPIKTRAAVRIETIAELLEILARHAARLQAANVYTVRGPVFPHPKSTPGDVRPYASGEVLSRRDLRSAVRAAGLPNVGAWSAHSLRDSFVTLEAAAAGGDLRRVASRSRHASLASLSRYLRALSREPAPPAIARLPTVVDGGAGPPKLGPAK